MKKEVFTIEFKGKKIISDIISNNQQAQVLLLHGAGNTNRTRYESLRELLMENNISSCAVDLLGHGETGGDIKETSLKERTEEILAVVSNLNIETPLHVFGFSMGGYTAIKLTEILSVELLVLFAPAVYDRKAYDIKFGYGFSEIIRADKSWQNTDAWEILNKFKGRVLIFIGDKDDVIPNEVVPKIYDSLVNAKFREVIILKNAPHKLGSYLNENDDMRKVVINKIIKELK